MIDGMKNILLEHFNRYPKMKVQDMVKLIYQNEFAGGHLIDNEEESLNRLNAEIESIKGCCYDSEGPLFEDIGNGLARLYLDKIPGRVDTTTVNKFFVNTSNSVHGSVDSFIKKINILRLCCEEGLLPYETEEVDSFLKVLSEKGYPPVSHSDEYRIAYNPAYRVVLSDYKTFFELFTGIDFLLKSKELVIVAIDGNSGAGKSYLSRLLSGIYDCNIFHMDDFFLTPGLRTAARLNEPGGNVDYVRFRHEVLNNIKNREYFTYRKYNCSKGDFDEQVKVSRRRLNIIEGCYSMHPYLINDYDLKIFLQVDKEKQKARILERNGPSMLERFMNEWIPLEDKYFNELHIPDKCDLVFSL